MDAEIPAPENSYPEVVNLSNISADSVQAELVRASASQIKQISAQEVDLRDSLAVVVDAETVNARKMNVAHVEAGNLTLLDGMLLAARTESLAMNGRAGIIAANSVDVENGNAGVLVCREVRAEAIRTGVLISRNVQGNVETLLDTRATVLTGLVAGAVVGTLLMLGQFLFRRR